MRINSFLSAASFAAAVLLFAGCSDGDEPAKVSGEEQVRHIAGAVFDTEGNNMFIPTADPDRFLVPCSSAEVARAVCGTFIDGEWNGKETTVKLEDNCGHVKVVPDPKPGVYAEVYFGLVPVPGLDVDDADIEFSLEVADSNYCEDENPFIAPLPVYSEWQCNGCGRTYIVAGSKSPAECAGCHGKSFRKLSK